MMMHIIKLHAKIDHNNLNKTVTDCEKELNYLFNTDDARITIENDTVIIELTSRKSVDSEIRTPIRHSFPLKKIKQVYSLRG